MAQLQVILDREHEIAKQALKAGNKVSFPVDTYVHCLIGCFWNF